MRWSVFALLLVLVACGRPAPKGSPANLKTPIPPLGSFGISGLDPNDENIIFEVATKDSTPWPMFSLVLPLLNQCRHAQNESINV